MDENELRKKIALLKWDLQMLTNREIRDMKEKELKSKEAELKELLSKVTP